VVLLKTLIGSILKAKSHKDSLRFALKAILIFLAFRYFFIAYTGITVEGGNLYSPFLAEYFNVIALFRKFLLWGGSEFVYLMGYTSYYTEFFLVVPNGASVELVYSCLGLDLIGAYIALMCAWPARRFKLVSTLVGTAIIIVLNMVRLGGLVVLYATKHIGFFQYIDHHDLFNVFMLIIVLVMFAIHVNISAHKITRI
jgi:exosortase/archaeosortase family protein